VELRHLTDEEIQDYLDGNIPEENKYVQEHLRTCERCRKALLEYQSLYLGLKKDHGFELPGSFPKTVISKLPKEPMIKPRLKYAEILLAILGVVGAVFVGNYFIGFKPLIQTISGIHLPQFEFISTFLRSLGDLLTELNMNSSLVIFSGLTLLIIGSLDHIILHRRQKPISSSGEMFMF
jgi:hypothetical protein